MNLQLRVCTAEETELELHATPDILPAADFTGSSRSPTGCFQTSAMSLIGAFNNGGGNDCPL